MEFDRVLRHGRKGRTAQAGRKPADQADIADVRAWAPLPAGDYTTRPTTSALAGPAVALMFDTTHALAWSSPVG